MKKILFLAAAMMFLFGGSIYGQDNRKTVAVLPAEGEAVGREIRIGITNALQEGVYNSGEYKLVARGNAFEKALSEMKFQQSGAVSDDQLTRFGRALKADFVCYATISKFSGSAYRISYKFIDVASAEAVGMGSETVRDGADGLLTAADNIASKLFGRSSSGGAPVRASGGASSGRSQTITASGVTFEMVYVQGGSFTMGCTQEQGSDCYDDEKPPHRVSLPDFYIGKHEVTQLLWRTVMGDNPSNWKGDNLPVENVSWDDCQTFISRLNSLTGKQFRLPTEAQWEYAARGGARSAGYKYSGGHDLYDVAWYEDNSGARTHEVGGKQPNELGIYDMSGNVWEWCRDWFGDNYYGASVVESPTGPSSGSGRVLRGGSWNYSAGHCRVAYRVLNTPSLRYSRGGLRLVLP